MAACHMPQGPFRPHQRQVGAANRQVMAQGTSRRGCAGVGRSHASRHSISFKTPLYNERMHGRAMTAKAAKAATCMAAVLTVLLFVPIGMSTAQVPGGTTAGPVGPVSHTGDLAALESAIHDYKRELDGESHSERQEALENVITRLGIAKAIVQSSHNLGGTAPQYQNLTTDQLLVLLHATYEPGDFVDSRDDASSTLANSVASYDQMIMMPAINHPTSFSASHASPSMDVRRNNNHYQHQYDCRDLSFVSGLAHSVLTSYTNGRAQITGSFSYPADMDKRITERRDSTCLEFEHVETVKRHHVLASSNPRGGHVKAQVCTLTATNPIESASVWCNAFGPGRLTLITTTNTYEVSSQSLTTQLGSTTSTLLAT